MFNSDQGQYDVADFTTSQRILKLDISDGTESKYTKRLFLDLYFSSPFKDENSFRAVKYEDQNRSMNIKLLFMEPDTDYLSENALHSNLSYAFTFIKGRLVAIESDELKI